MRIIVVVSVRLVEAWIEGVGLMNLSKKSTRNLSVVVDEVEELERYVKVKDEGLHIPASERLGLPCFTSH